jgi:hypothetical protein
MTSRKMKVRAESRMVSAISFGVFWRVGALDQADHVVEEALAGVGGDAMTRLVGEDARAAGDGAAVAAGLADDGRGLAGDGGLVHRGGALDDLAVAGDQLAGRTTTRSSLRSWRSVDRLEEPSLRRRAGDQLLARGAQRAGLRLAAALGHGLGEIGEDDGEEQPEGHLEHVAEGLLGDEELLEGQQAPSRVTNITGFLSCCRGSSFLKESATALRMMSRSKREMDLELMVVLRLGKRAQNRVPAPIRKCSTIGPIARAGRKVRAPTRRTVPIRRMTKVTPSTSEGADAGRDQLLAGEVAGQRQDRDDHQEAPDQHRDASVVSQWGLPSAGLAVRPAKALPLLPTLELKA